MADQLEGKSGDGLSSKRLVADRERTSLSISSIRTFARADVHHRLTRLGQFIA
jgi:hypothetical protein